MPLMTEIEWSVQAALELQEHLAELPDTKTRKRLLMEVYECGTFFVERYLDTMRHVHPEVLVHLLNRADVEITRPDPEDALLWVKAITYGDPVGETATGIRAARGVYA